VSKSAFKMIYLALKEELKGHNVVIGSVKPGVVNTPLLVTHSLAPQPCLFEVNPFLHHIAIGHCLEGSRSRAAEDGG